MAGKSPLPRKKVASQFKPPPSAYTPPPRRPSTLATSKPATSGRWRVPLGFLIFTVAGYLSLSAVSNARSPAPETAADVPEDVSSRYHATAQDFDSQIGTQEMLMGMNWLRSWMAREAAGHVLEMSVGTARNSRYYKLDKCKSITMVDQAPEMIEIARTKFRKAHPAYQSCRFVAQSVHEPIQHPPEGFDTIVQTMGVCSIAHPANALRQLGTITNPHHGRILLLEHGRSHYAWLNDFLDRHASARADKFGCWWNKDIGKIVKDSGLEVVCIKRYHFGTTWWVELKPKPPS